MTNDMTPATKADLDMMKDVIIKAVQRQILQATASLGASFSSLETSMQQQFHTVAGQLNAVLTMLHEHDEQLGKLDDDLYELLAQTGAITRDHARRIERLERKVGIAA